MQIRHEGACIMRARARQTFQALADGRGRASRVTAQRMQGREKLLPSSLEKKQQGATCTMYSPLCHEPWRLNTNAVVFCSRLLYTRSGRSARRTSWRRWPKTGATHPCRERWRFRLTLWTVQIIRPYGTT